MRPWGSLAPFYGLDIIGEFRFTLERELVPRKGVLAGKGESLSGDRGCETTGGSSYHAP
jgi:hypothetical protein